MARKYKLTRPELKRQQDLLRRFTRYLPMLKLKQQQLQVTVRQTRKEIKTAGVALAKAETAFAAYSSVLRDRAGLDVVHLATASQIRTRSVNVAGIAVPAFDEVSFPEARYSLFVSPVWVDQALSDMREVSRRHAEVHVLKAGLAILERELTRVSQRVNLFEKVKIPESQDAIRRIRIHLGDEMTAAVARAKIAKAKLVSQKPPVYPFVGDEVVPVTSKVGSSAAPSGAET